jgi:hypothetical protein
MDKHDDHDQKINEIPEKASFTSMDELRKQIEQEDPGYLQRQAEKEGLYRLPVTNPLMPDIIIEKMSIVVPEPIQWLWKDKIAYRKITLFAGEPGVGKSQLLLYIASIVSNGGKFHFESKSCQPENVLLISGEDHAGDTISPRLLALNANMDKIDHVKGIQKLNRLGEKYFDSICLMEHLEQLQEKIKENKYKLIIIDPISEFLGSVDENKNKEIRTALAMLNSLAENNDLAIIINSHFTKPSGNVTKNAIYRIMGSIGFAARSRIVYGILKDPENPERRLFLPIKNNIGNDREGLVYEIKSIVVNNNIPISRVNWLNEKTDKTANDILNPSVGRQSPRLEEAKEILLEMLKSGSIPLTEIRKRTQEQGISVDRLYEAKRELNIYETQSNDRRRGKIWMLAP